MKTPCRRGNFEVSLPGWPVEVLFYRSKKSKKPHLGWRLAVTCEVPDAKTGEVGYFGSRTEIDFHSRIITRAKAARFIKEAVLRQIDHEIRECLLIDGRRAFQDPHTKKKKRA